MDYVIERRRAQQIDFTSIRQPRVGEVLTTRMLKSGRKVFVSDETRTVACLAPGDKLVLESMSSQFDDKWLGGNSRAIVTCGMDGGDHVVLENGRRIPMSKLSRRMDFVVLSMVPQRHHDEHESDNAPAVAIQTQLASVNAQTGELAVGRLTKAKRMVAAVLALVGIYISTN